MAEQPPCKRQVVGSIPTLGSLHREKSHVARWGEWLVATREMSLAVLRETEFSVLRERRFLHTAQGYC